MNYGEYLKQRAIIEEENKNLIGNVLNADELKVNEKLNRLKAEVLEHNETDRLYKMNLLSNADLFNSDLYRFIGDLPKACDLHVHATALLPARKLMDFVENHKKLVVDINSGCIHHICEENYDKNTCFPLSVIYERGLLDCTELEKKWTMLGKKHSENVWEYFENLLCLFEAIEFDYEILYDYYVTCFNYYLKNNVFHIEIHALLSEDTKKAFELANVIKRAYFAVKDSHPELCVSIICAGLKYVGVGEKSIKNYLGNALRMRNEIVDDYDKQNPHPFIIGFDLVNEEDKSVPLKDIAPLLLECAEKYPDFNLYLHCGESLNAQSDNLIDGYLLNAKRVGHGMNLYRYPKLLQRYAEKEICLECCVISNQTLKYTKDIRLHPGAEYLKRGVTVSLCSDDPVCQEHETLTDDFFAATVCWDLNLADLKQLSINSILYSGVDKFQKSMLIAHFKNAWRDFINKYI
ncbi:MAG: hypothetical protein MJ080_05225 [Clostridia bacterium]|nr:hypothetical protein [Clostridia bacterium]